MVNHPNRSKRVYADATLVDALRSAGVDCRLLWEYIGPKDTSIAWVSCYQIGRSVCIVQTFKDEGGWNAFTPPLTDDISETVSDVIIRCHAKVFRPNNQAATWPPPSSDPPSPRYQRRRGLEKR